MKQISAPVVAITLMAALSGCVKDGGDDGGGGLFGGPGPEGPAALGEDESRVMGLVIDSEFVPVAGATVSILPADLHLETDGNGSFDFSPIPPGTYVVHAEKRGYAPVSAEATVAAGQSKEVLLSLDPLASDVPYHETITFAGYVQCHFFFQVITPVGPATLNAPCVGAIDLLTGQNVSNDKFIFPFVISSPGFSNLLIEMTWDRQQFGTNAVAIIWGSREAAQTSGTTTQYFGMGSAPPLQALLTPGQDHAGSQPGEQYFYPTPNATEEFQYVWAGGGGNTTVQQVALFLELRSYIYLTFFYNRPAPPDFSILPDE